MSNQSSYSDGCSAGSWCRYSSYLGKNRKKGYHPTCECGFRFNCFSTSHEYCKIKEYKCTKCCIASMHKSKKCSECHKDVGVSCHDICFDIIGTKCKDCDKCTVCDIPFYKTEHNINYCKGVCQTCYEKNDKQVKCYKRKCKRYIKINLLFDDPNAKYPCHHPMCKK